MAPADGHGLQSWTILYDADVQLITVGYLVGCALFGVSAFHY